MADIIIRPVTGGDSQAIARLWRELVAYHQNLDSGLPEAAPDGPTRYARQVWHKLDDPHTCALVAEVDGQVVGYVLGMIVDLMPDMFAQEQSGFLADIYVDSAFRRQGIGQMLVNALRVWFRDCGVACFDWHVAARNTNALAFWGKIGGRAVMVRMRAHLKDETNV